MGEAIILLMPGEDTVEDSLEAQAIEVLTVPTVPIPLSRLLCVGILCFENISVIRIEIKVSACNS